MNPSRTWIRSLVAVWLVAGCWATAQAGPFSGLVVFGDSLSDSGNDLLITGGLLPAPSVYTDGDSRHTGRFTNGLNYVDRLAGLLDLNLTASVAGGSNYAYGGARTSSVNAGLMPFGALSFNQQVAAYQEKHASSDPGALYVLWIGANDMSDAVQARAAGDLAAIPNAIANAMAGIGGAIGGLGSRGAQHFLVPDLPDLSLVPAVREFNNPGLSFIARSASQAFNASLAGLLQQPALGAFDLRSLGVYELQTRITQFPGLYGLSDVTTACFTGEVDGGPRLGGPAPTTCVNPGQHLYFDYEHPSAALHAQLADIALAALVPEPRSAGLLLLGLLWLGLRRPRPADRQAASAGPAPPDAFL